MKQEGVHATSAVCDHSLGAVPQIVVFGDTDVAFKSPPNSVVG